MKTIFWIMTAVWWLTAKVWFIIWIAVIIAKIIWFNVSMWYFGIIWLMLMPFTIAIIGLIWLTITD